MKKWIIIGLVAIVALVGTVSVMSIVGVRANDSALEEIRDKKETVVLDVSGMT